jgi:uncharacterized phage protein (TIGR01671 family)
MKREIKFRIFDEEIKEMIYPHDRSDLSHHIFLTHKDGISYLNYQNNAMTANVMQFTGLLDSNMKEIYEGDIITSNSPKVKQNLVVKFIDGAFCIGNDRAGEEFCEDDYCTIRDAMFQAQTKTLELRLTIIGNIYENPELLK